MFSIFVLYYLNKRNFIYEGEVFVSPVLYYAFFFSGLILMSGPIVTNTARMWNSEWDVTAGPITLKSNNLH